MNGEDFTTPAPSWIGDANESQVPRPEWEAQMRPIWTEEILTELAILVEHEGEKTRYLMPVD